MQTRVFLIGMMGSGKSRWGKRLAEHLEWPFMDLDAEIVREDGRSIADIFETSGEAFFRALETEILKKTAALPAVIVATGGGAPCFFNNIDWMNANGRTILIETPVEELVQRIQRQPEKRPLLAGLSENDLTLKIQQMLTARAGCYNQANVVVQWTDDEAEMLKKLTSVIIL